MSGTWVGGRISRIAASFAAAVLAGCSAMDLKVGEFEQDSSVVANVEPIVIPRRVRPLETLLPTNPQIAFENQDVISGDGFYGLVSCHHIHDKGDIRIYNEREDLIQTIDMSFKNLLPGDEAVDNPLAYIFATMSMQAAVKIKSSDVVSQLLEKPVWSHTDREDWEEEVANIVSETMFGMQGLNLYRTSSRDDVIRPKSLNRVVEDIVHGTAYIEFDCEGMSAFEGMMVQSMEDLFLPLQGEDRCVLKQAHKYYVAAGNVSSGRGIGAHAFIVSSATGNIIESTDTPNAVVSGTYFRTPRDYTIKDFINWMPCFAEATNTPYQDTSVYGRFLTPEIVSAMFAERDKYSTIVPVLDP